MLTNTFKTLFIKRKLFSLQNIRFIGVKAEREEHNENISQENQSQQKLLKLAVIGLPNAGKSTFINNLMDRKVNLCM